MYFSYNVHDIGAMSDRIEDIRKGFMILVPVLDEKGRAIIYFNPALMEDKVEEVSTIHHNHIMASSFQIIA